MDNTAANFGRLFEIGFNIGILSFIQQQNIKHNFSDVYQQDLAKINFSKIKQKKAKGHSEHIRCMYTSH